MFRIRPTCRLQAAPRGSALLAAAVLAWPCAHAAEWPETGPTRTVCPDSPARASAAQGRGAAEAAPAELLPGLTASTLGTTVAETPRLAGTLLRTDTASFSIALGGSNVITGTVEQRLLAAGPGNQCDTYTRVRVLAAPAGAKVRQIRIRGFNHPATGLYGDYRTDLAGGASVKAPASVKRSAGAGTTITFDFPGGIAAGQSSRWVFLDTVAPNVELIGEMTLRAATGQYSGAVATWVPVP